MKKIFFITVIIGICAVSTLGFSEIADPSDNLNPEVLEKERSVHRDYLYSEELEKESCVVADYQDFQWCQKKCREYCRGSSRPAYCFERCMIPCTP